MLRFFKNRLWTFILALILGLGGVALLSSGSAHAGDAPAISDDQGTGGGGTGAGFGDPDAPSGAAKRAMLRGGVRVASGGATIAGDDVGLHSGWMWRLRVVLQAVRGSWLHP